MQYKSEERIRSIPYGNTLLGTAMHNTLEDFYGATIAGSPITDLKQMEDMLLKYFWAEVSGAGDNINLRKDKSKFSSEDEWRDFYQGEISQLYATGKTLLGAFFKQHFADDGRYQPEAVELNITTELPDADDYPGLKGVKFTAKIDYLEFDTLTKQYRMLDHKLSARFDKSKLQNNDQLTLYAYLINRVIKKPVSAVGYQIFDTSTKKVSRILGSRTEPQFKSLLRNLAAIVPSMKLPFSYKRFGDHCKWCPVKDRCFSGEI